jgi:hypothetical protein
MLFTLSLYVNVMTLRVATCNYKLVFFLFHVDGRKLEFLMYGRVCLSLF